MTAIQRQSSQKILPLAATHKDLLDMVKVAFNSMLNSPKLLKQAPAGVKPSKFGLKWAEVSEKISAFHEPIARHFYTGVGLRLQRLDNDIAEKVLLHFALKGQAILPLHDSFLMHYADENLLDPATRLAFEEVVRLPPKIDRKIARRRVHIESQTSDDKFGPNTSQVIAELLASRSGHDRRLDAFYSLKARNTS